ncbi:MAG: hypothetical protein OEU92_03870 [Alphaproteobacteria bacterium]|nr:hypothetical protein [Alphaproteobacteria bacterium]
MPEYVVITYGPDNRQTGDHVAQRREDAIDYVRHYLDEESRDGAFLTISIIGAELRQLGIASR